MIALDTNVLVRFLVRDDATQTTRAARMIKAADARGDQLFITTVVFCEVTWVLSFAYKTPKQELVATMRTLLRTRQLVFELHDGLARAVDAFEKGNGDLADYVIREAARVAGCASVATFDKALLKEAGFVAV